MPRKDLSWANGTPDGHGLTRDEMAAAVARIVAALRVPVTADIEGGYGDVAATVRAVIRAGADGLFVPDLIDLDAIARLAKGPLPLNVMAGPGAPPVAELAAAGVVRVSVGSAIAQSAYTTAVRAATELLGAGTYEALTDGLDYGTLNSALR